MKMSNVRQSQLKRFRHISLGLLMTLNVAQPVYGELFVAPEAIVSG